jgi:hypothetical protein
LSARAEKEGVLLEFATRRKLLWTGLPQAGVAVFSVVATTLRRGVLNERNDMQSAST